MYPTEVILHINTSLTRFQDPSFVWQNVELTLTHIDVMIANLKSHIRRLAIIIGGLFKSDRRSRVIFYHDVTVNFQYTSMSTPLDLFKAHIQTIKELGFNIVPRITQPMDQIQICFDDGFKGIWDCRQYFIDNGIKPTVFIADSLIGQDGYLNLAQIRQLYDDGFLFEGHTNRHSNLTLFSPEGLRAELAYSIQNLRKITGIKIQDLCFPQGFYSNQVVQTAKECGYRKLYTSDPGPYNPDSNLIPRYLLQDATISVVRATLFGGQDFLVNHYRNYHKKS